MAGVSKIPAPIRSLTPDNTNVFKLGSNYFVVRGPGSTCSNDQTIQDLANQQANTFIKDFKTVQLDQ